MYVRIEFLLPIVYMRDCNTLALASRFSRVRVRNIETSNCVGLRADVPGACLMAAPRRRKPPKLNLGDLKKNLVHAL